MAESTFQPRPAQTAILHYTQGPMGISAVPGSGKTFTLSLLAARLVEQLASAGRMDNREVLVVTLTNSAVENFRRRINSFVQREQGLLPGVGYRVRTLHGLAHDIVRERPALVGLSEAFDIVDERTSADIKREAVRAYRTRHPDLFGAYLLPEFLQRPARVERYLEEDAIAIADAVIRSAKELRMTPAHLQPALQRQSGYWPLLDFGLQVYADYQRSLTVRGGVDFDDLIVLALQALDADPGYLDRLQERWPYILEDEAQDSSRLQEEMLRRLTARHGNWVRVGDPNQAINTTFTSADTRFLQEFIRRHPQQQRDLPNSGRSAQPIIDLANYLAAWSRRDHPVLGPELALALPEILPTPPGDPQPNPQPGDPAVWVYDRALTPEQELEVVLKSLTRWLPQNGARTVAVLAPDNQRGFKVAEALQKAKLPFDDSLLRTDSATRAAARALATVLAYLTTPHTPSHLEPLWRDVWWPRRLAAGPWTPAEVAGSPVDGKLPAVVEHFGRALRRANLPEQFVYPAVGADWLESLDWLEQEEGFRELVEAFRADLRRWTAALELPIDELLLTLGQDLFTAQADLALTHHLAVWLAKLARENPGWRLPELARALDDIVQNRRRIQVFSEESGGYEPRPGQATVATMHAAKGLEWDRVYLLAVNDYSFPTGSAEARYRAERWFVRDRLNLVAESVAQLHLLQSGSLDDYEPGAATQQARIELAAERLRLLYVGITRARQELILTYNTGRSPTQDPNVPAAAFAALADYLAAQRG